MSTIITLPRDPTWKPLDWAKKNCPSYITNDLHRFEYQDGQVAYDIHKIDYYFANEKDATLFALRWS